jgi:hypothetical protein
LNFVQPAKGEKKNQTKKVDKFSVLPSNIEPLDSNSVQILKDLLSFVDKE